MPTKFKAGDLVVVREWGDMVQEFGYDPDGQDEIIATPQTFTEDMRRFCGMKAQVINPRRGLEENRMDVKFLGEADDISDDFRGYAWDEGMFRLAVSKYPSNWGKHVRA